jgi:transposase InsO family protein
VGAPGACEQCAVGDLVGCEVAPGVAGGISRRSGQQGLEGIRRGKKVRFVNPALILDCYSRMIVGWQLATHLRGELVLDALEMANGLCRQPRA